MKEQIGNLTIFGREIIDDNSIRQIQNCIGKDDIGVLTADAHYGYAHPIGGAVAYKDKVSVSGVGFDIACGNKAVKTDLRVENLSKDLPHIMDEIFRRISFGVGRPNNEPVDHEVFDKIAKAEFAPQRNMLKLAKEQLGTVGSGNHYVDLFEGNDGFLWIGVHFGSRGFGHKTATGFIAMSQGLSFADRGKEGSMDSPPILLDIHSELGQSYIEAMNLAGDYAYAGRDMVVDKVLEILGNPKVGFEVHNHHNFAWREKHFGEAYWVVRKGCTPAFPGQQGFIGANMLDTSVIIEGLESELSKKSLYSTVHGAGRVLSRTQAAGKKKWIKDKFTGKKVPTIVAKGKVDFDAVKLQMKGKQIELRGAGADEAPEVYKDLQEVLAHMGGTIKILHTLNPIGVAMAGGDVIDPYKD
jgi:tRNA-splicing ligase RtcB (3'-phosphate/5'-hydroxy nucleic acid ligase)